MNTTTFIAECIQEKAVSRHRRRREVGKGWGCLLGQETEHWRVPRECELSARHALRSFLTALDYVRLGISCLSGFPDMTDRDLEL